MASFIPTVALLIYAYFFLLAVWAVLSLVIVYHLLRFGFFSLANIIVIMIYLLISLILAANSLTLIYGWNWTAPLFGSIDFGNFFESSFFNF